MRRNFSLVASYLLKFTSCSLHVVKSFVTRCKICSLPPCKIRSLFVAEVARCEKSLITLAKLVRYSLQKITHYSLQNLLITRCRNCSLQKITHYLLQNSFVTRCKSEITFCIFIKKRPQHGYFSVNFCKISKTPILQIICERLLLKIISKR